MPALAQVKFGESVAILRSPGGRNVLSTAQREGLKGAFALLVEENKRLQARVDELLAQNQALSEELGRRKSNGSAPGLDKP